MSLNNEVLTAIAARRSCRAYQPQQITDAELDAVTAAGTWAPTAMNRQSSTIVVVQDKATRDELSALNAKIMGTTADPFYGAPTALLVLGDAENRNTVQDGSLVLGNLMLAASSLGLGSCWINRARETFELPEGKALLQKWGFDPEKTVGIGYCILGYPAEGGVQAAAPRKANYVVKV